jgi:hypothetical protein
MINSAILFAAYLLGALIFVLDEIKKYENIANANPNPDIQYGWPLFWKKEKINVIQMFLYGVVAVIIFPMLFGGSNFALRRETGEVIWSVPMKTALIPLMIVLGWTGGRAVIAFMGKSKRELYRSVGIEDDK